MIDFILRPIRRRFGKDRRFYAAIDDMFGFIPHNIELYKLALIHKSASVTLDDGRQINNERLEFLGDAVIESVTSDYLFIEFPDQNEGFLTQLRSKMVSRQSLNEVAKRIKLDTHVITHSSASFSQKHIYGDAFEAMMGAIYLDQGYDFVNRLLINRIFGDYLRTGALLEEETDFKSRLIEWCQKNHHTIRFITSHDKSYSSAHPVFNCKVLIDDIEAGYGSGDSKKEAEQRAAYSVSQGFREEDCTKLFDKLDAIDRGIAPAPHQRYDTDGSPADTETVRQNGETKADGQDNAGDGTAAKGSGRSRSARRARKRAAAAAQADIQTDAQTDAQTDIQIQAAENIGTNAAIADITDTSADETAAEAQTALERGIPAEAAEAAEGGTAATTDTAGFAETTPDKPAAQGTEDTENVKDAEKKAGTTTEAEAAPAADTAPAESPAPKRRSRRRTPKTAPANGAAAGVAEPDNMPDTDAGTPGEEGEKAEKGEDETPAAIQNDKDTATAGTDNAPKQRTRRRTPKAASPKAGADAAQAAGALPEESSDMAQQAVRTDSGGPAAENSAAPKRRPRRRPSKTAAEKGEDAGAGKPEGAVTAEPAVETATTITTGDTETAVDTAE